MSTQSQLKSDTNRAQKGKPLIPESVLDPASQRYYILALFSLVQAWKAYDLYVLNDDTLKDLLQSQLFFSFLSPKLTFIFKYFFLDGVIILAIPFLNIPKLPLSPIFSILSLILINILTVSLTSSLNFSLFTIVSSFWKLLVPEKELAIMETYIDSDSVFDQSSHFKGKKTIRYAPDSSIKLNPFGQHFCLRPTYGDRLTIPIRLESTYELEYLQIIHHDLNNIDTVLNYTKKDINKLVASDYYLTPYAKYDSTILIDDKVSILELPIDKPGYYSILSATDKKRKVIRSYRSDTVIPMCPEAAFTLKDPVDDKCVDDEFTSLSITVLGAPPFTLYYEEEINGVLSHLPYSVIIPEDQDDSFYSPLLSKDLYTGQQKQSIKYSSSDLKNISWARSRSINVPAGNKRVDKAGKYIYTINKVIDGFGNIVNYTPDPSSLDTFFTYNAHPMPMVSLVDPNPQTPILIGQKKFIDVRLSQVPCVDCEQPYTVLFKYVPNENDTDTQEYTFTKTFDFKSKSRIKVDKPGTFSIENASSNYCGCKLGPSSLNILSARFPKVDISLDPIIDNCVGTTGFKFNFDFVGNAPFEIGYKISKLDPADSNHVLKVEKVSSLLSESTVLEYSFKPPTEGSYSIEFISLSDKYYKNQVKFQQNEHRYVTYFKQRPKAYFNKNTKVQRIGCCNGGSSQVYLHLEGKSPFSIVYDIIAPDYSTESFTINGVENNKIPIKTPEFFKGGEYVLTLKSVKDSTNCDVEFKGQEIHIDVRSDVPQLSFTKSQEFNIIQGKSLNVPLRTQSNELIDLAYKFESLNGDVSEEKHLRNYNPTNGLSLTDEGIYSLVSFKQGGCEGKVSNDYKVIVRYLPKPTLKIVNKTDLSLTSNNVFVKNTLCKKYSGFIDLQATGISPFIVHYDVKLPNGMVEQKTEQVTNKNFALQLQTSESGDYEYTIKGIYDSTYTPAILKQLQSADKYSFDPISIRHHVSSLPLAKFLNKEHNYQTCVSLIDDKTKVTPISVELTGELPISLKLHVYHEHDSTQEILTLTNLDTPVFDLYSIYQSLGIGTHVVSLYEVTDSKGCTSSELDLNSESIMIQVSDIPKIRHLVEESPQLSDFDSPSSNNYYCVGDHITYMLNGVSPFTINYEFNDQLQKVEIQGNYFKRRAPGPGELNIVSLSDSSGKGCLVDYSDLNRLDLKALIYDLPSVEIVTGDSIEEDIHEGEQVEITFKLSGTPPFKLTYIRTELGDESKIVETEVIDNIIGNEYKIMANLEGTYEAIEIQDAYCVAKNY